MKTSITARIAALVASVFVTFATVHVIANYALPAAPAIELAQVAHQG